MYIYSANLISQKYVLCDFRHDTHLRGCRVSQCLAKEIRVWSKLDHPNVLTFLGYALEGEDYPLLISEWMDNGTVKTYMKGHPECDVALMVSKADLNVGGHRLTDMHRFSALLLASLICTEKVLYMAT